jgi:hypothetical protein
MQENNRGYIVPPHLTEGITKKGISRASFLKNLPLSLFTKEEYNSSLWQREVRRDFIIESLYM